MTHETKIGFKTTGLNTLVWDNNNHNDVFRGGVGICQECQREWF